MSVSYCLFLGCLATVSAPSEQCSPVEPLATALQAARETTVNGRITLNMDKPGPAISTIDLPTCPGGQAKVAAMYRVPAGQTAMFSCTVPGCSNSESCAQLGGISWGHRNYSVRHVISQYDSSPFTYTLAKNATICSWNRALFMECHEDKYCVLTVYNLKPLLSAVDIFITPAQRIAVPAGQNLTLRCDLQAALYGALPLEQRYMWWYGSQVIMAPSQHPVAGLVRPLRFVSFVIQVTYTSAVIVSPPKTASGRYQCWVRPFEELDEWFTQDIYLDLV